jgi:hypothetical protein
VKVDGGFQAAMVMMLQARGLSTFCGAPSLQQFTTGSTVD